MQYNRMKQAKKMQWSMAITIEPVQYIKWNWKARKEKCFNYDSINRHFFYIYSFQHTHTHMPNDSEKTEFFFCFVLLHMSHMEQKKVKGTHTHIYCMIQAANNKLLLLLIHSTEWILKNWRQKKIESNKRMKERKKKKELIKKQNGMVWLNEYN